MPQAEKHKDVQLGYRFWVEIDGIQVAGFSECSPLTMEVETLDQVEGGLNTFVHRLPVRTKYGNITLKRGVDTSGDLYEWAKDVITGTPKKRRNLTITLYAPDLTVIRKYSLKGAYPVRWTGPELRTEAGAVAVESLEFAFEEVISIEKS